MASLRKRKGVYYIVFSQRHEGKLVQKAFSLGVKRKSAAQVLLGSYQERYALGKIDPFGGWTPRSEIEQKRGPVSQGNTLGVMVEGFLKSRSHIKPVTYQEYRRLLHKLVENIGLTMPVTLITQDDVRHYCFQAHFSAATQTTYLRFCKMFFKWLYDEGHIAKNPCERIKYPKAQHNTSGKVISEDQLLLLFDTFKQHQRPKILRGQTTGLHVWFKPLAALFYYAGLRAREGVTLHWDNVDLERARLFITGTKTGRERVVPIRAKLLPYLVAWHRLSGRPRQGLVFSKGTFSDQSFPLTTDHVSKTFKKYARLAGLPETVNLHGLRHSCATELLRLGLGIHEVATWLGHASLETTRIYEHLNDRDLQRRIEQLGL